MRTFLLLILGICLSSTSQAQRPDVAVRIGAAFHDITQFDDAFGGFAAEVEVTMTEHWAIDAAVSLTSSDPFDANYFRGGLRYYPKQSLRGFFGRAGLGWANLEHEGGARLDFPFRSNNNSEVTFAIAEVGVGFSTLVKEHISMSIQANLGGLPSYESAHWSLGFTLGIAL